MYLFHFKGRKFYLGKAKFFLEAGEGKFILHARNISAQKLFTDLHRPHLSSAVVTLSQKKPSHATSCRNETELSIKLLHSQ